MELIRLNIEVIVHLTFSCKYTFNICCFSKDEISPNIEKCVILLKEIFLDILKVLLSAWWKCLIVFLDKIIWSSEQGDPHRHSIVETSQEKY